MTETIHTRAEIPAKYKWNAASLYPSDKAWEAEADSLLVTLDDLKRMGGSAGKSAQTVANALDARNALLEIFGKVITYSYNSQGEDYLRFLSAGSSVYPLDALKMAGVDMSTPQPVEETFDVLRQMVDRLEELTSGRQ